MKITLMSLGLSGLLLFSQPAEAPAAVVTQVLSFSPARSIVDSASGSQPNFTYEHFFASPPTNSEILGGRLSLTHSGNSNTGPTQEIWRLVSGLNSIGLLSTSDRAAAEDSWNLSSPVLSSILSGEVWKLAFSLIEETPFNSERLDLLRSELNLEYRSRPQEKLPAPPPSVPEPAEAFLAGLGIFLSGVFRKASGAAKRD